MDSAVFIDNAMTGLPVHTRGTHVVMGIQDIMLRIDVQSSQAGTAELTGKDLVGATHFFIEIRRQPPIELHPPQAKRVDAIDQCDPAFWVGGAPAI